MEKKINLFNIFVYFFGANYDELLTNSISAVDAVLIYIVYDVPSESDANYIRKANKILVADREIELNGKE